MSVTDNDGVWRWAPARQPERARSGPEEEQASAEIAPRVGRRDVGEAIDGPEVDGHDLVLSLLEAARDLWSRAEVRSLAPRRLGATWARREPADPGRGHMLSRAPAVRREEGVGAQTCLHRLVERDAALLLIIGLKAPDRQERPVGGGR